MIIKQIGILDNVYYPKQKKTVWNLLILWQNEYCKTLFIVWLQWILTPLLRSVTLQLYYIEKAVPTIMPQWLRRNSKNNNNTGRVIPHH